MCSVSDKLFNGKSLLLAMCFRLKQRMGRPRPYDKGACNENDGDIQAIGFMGYTLLFILYCPIDYQIIKRLSVLVCDT